MKLLTAVYLFQEATIFRLLWILVNKIIYHFFSLNYNGLYLKWYSSLFFYWIGFILYINTFIKTLIIPPKSKDLGFLTKILWKNKVDFLIKFYFFKNNIDIFFKKSIIILLNEIENWQVVKLVRHHTLAVVICRFEPYPARICSLIFY